MVWPEFHHVAHRQARRRVEQQATQQARATSEARMTSYQGRMLDKLGDRRKQAEVTLWMLGQVLV